MHWTSEKPTKPGKYYFRWDERDPSPCQVLVNDEDLKRDSFSKGQWAVPIPEPTERKEEQEAAQEGKMNEI